MAEVKEEEQQKKGGIVKIILFVIGGILLIILGLGIGYFIFSGERYKILKAEIGNGSGHPGDILNDELEIACSNNESIKVIEIQKEGKKIQKINEFLNGSKIHKGCILNE